MKMAILGTGSVGLFARLCVSDFGHDLVCVDRAHHSGETIKDA